jgi:histidinol-phosphate/aromatic aminotransferase/cobyric acid decarboxylase-like protein
MPPSARPELANLQAAVHGGDAPPGVVDFSTGVSPLPVPKPVLAAARASDLSRYPHPTALPLRIAVARAHGGDPEEVVAGAGSTELIWALAGAFGGPGRTVLAPRPGFAEYAQAARASGARVVEFPGAGPHAGLDLGRAALLAREASLIFLPRPSTPWPEVPPAEAVESLCRAAPDALVVVDEAYLPLFDEVQPLRAGGNLAILRSLTKALALPGLRIGYLLADRAVASAVRAALPPWNVSAPAAAAGIAAIERPVLLVEAREAIGRLREDLAKRLRAEHADIVAGGGPFLLCEVGAASAFTAALLRRRLRVRDCTSFGLPRHVRLGVRLPPENAAVAAAFRAAREEAR